MFDPECKEYLTPESDGSVKIDSHPTLIQFLITAMECDSQEDRDRVFRELRKKYGIHMILQWINEFENKYIR